MKIATPGRPKKIPVTAEERAQIALARFSPLRDGEPMKPLKVLAKEYNRAEAVVSRAIAAAFSQGLVEIRGIDRPPAQYKQNDALQKRMREAFPNLHKVIVIDGREFGVGELERGDLLHQQLGQAMAKFIQDSISHGDTLGLGSGRGVYFTVEALRRSSDLRAQNVTIMSLTGALFPKAHSAGFSALLDADIHVALLAIGFEEQVTLKLISYPIAPDNLDAVRRNTWLDTEEFARHIPNRALIGVGVLDEGHRFYELVRRHRANEPEILQPIYDDLKKLVDLAEEVKARNGYCPVADICNRLFFVEPPYGEKVEPPKRQRIENVIGTLNERLLTIREDQLASIKQILLVAGTKRKALAISRLLDRDALKIEMLCTDSEAATEMLRLRTLEQAR